jgi:antitoxin (DNA-binding transcriptional repressor) of toxin-antitoxin stability system
MGRRIEEGVTTWQTWSRTQSISPMGDPVTEVGTHVAETHLSRLPQEVLLGEEVIIAKAGKRVARIVPHRERSTTRTPGPDRGLFEVPEDFDLPLPEEAQQGSEH